MPMRHVVALFRETAQRRPERQPRRHEFVRVLEHPAHQRSTKAGASTPATHLDPRRLAPVSSRSTKAGASTPATQGSGAQACRRRLRSTKAGASTPATLDTMSCSDFGFMNAQRRPERQPRLHVLGRRGGRRPDARSTKAGASTPATRIFAGPACRCRSPLNEGRSVNPGYTAKFCKRAVSGQTIARPRAREPRRRRVCGHFTRFWTIPRQNGQDQALRLP